MAQEHLSHKEAKAKERERQLFLQNLLCGVNERKVKVSPEFLENALLSYIGKRLNTVNKYVGGLSTTKSPKAYFAYCDIIDKCLDELIVIEPYYAFKKPKPSSFKKSIMDNREHSISSLLNRNWKSMLNRAIIVDGFPTNTQPFENFIFEVSLYKDRLTPTNLTALELFTHSLHRNDPEEDELDEENENGEVSETANGSEDELSEEYDVNAALDELEKDGIIDEMIAEFDAGKL